MTTRSRNLTASHTINGREFRTTMFAPDVSLRLLTKLSKLIGGPLGNAVGAFGAGDALNGDQNSALASLNGDDLGRAISTLFQGIESEDLPNLLRQMFAETSIKLDSQGDVGAAWTSVDLNRDFAGDALFDVFDLAAFVATHNWSGVLGKLKTSSALRKLLGVALAKGAQATS